MGVIRVGGLLLAVGGLALLWSTPNRGEVESIAPGTGVEVERSDSAPLDWFAIGGGASPEWNQVSLEQDVELAQRALGPHGEVYLAAGAGSNGVQVVDVAPRGDPLIARLGELFAPKNGRDGHYRSTRLQGAKPATEERVRARLDAAVTRSRESPLLLFISGHGHQGLTPSENSVGFWGGWELSVASLVGILDRAPASSQIPLVVTTCFGGGFAELIFREGLAANGITNSNRCGLFASPWDLEATGCDPDPDRRVQEGYALHFFHALRGLDRYGRPLDASEVDFDGDGAVSLLEAHARVRIASESADVPTTTSERYLWHVVRPADEGAQVSVALPVEEAVIAVLGGRLGLVGKESEAQGLLTQLLQAIEQVESAQEESAKREVEAFRAVAGEMLARWPVIDDPWHPDYPEMLARNRDELALFFERSPTYRDYLEVVETGLRLTAFSHSVRLQAAPLERLVRALDVRESAARLKARGGEEWRVFQRLRACEATVPRLGAASPD